MAHFIGKLQGSRGSASRLGTKRSGIEASAQGWELGAKVSIHHSDSLGYDVVEVFITSGSNATLSPVRIGSFRRNPDTGAIEACTSIGTTLHRGSWNPLEAEHAWEAGHDNA